MGKGQDGSERTGLMAGLQGSFDMLQEFFASAKNEAKDGAATAANMANVQNQLGNAHVFGLSSSYPEYEYSKDELVEAFLTHNPLNAEDEKFARRIFERTEIEKSNISLPKEDLFRKMTRDEYVVHLRTNCLKLGKEAAEKALDAWGGDRSKITHIVWGTMSVVMDTPTTDVHLMRSLGLSNFCKRLCVQQMGCLTGFRLLTLGASLAKEDPNNRVLVVCADVRSGLGNQISAEPEVESPPGSFNRSAIVSAALFRDAGGACVIGTDPGASTAPAGESKPLVEVMAHESFLIPGTDGLVKITEGDGAVIHWHNDTGLPAAVAENAPLVTKTLGATLKRTAGLDLDPSAVPWCVHTGGPKVLNLVMKSMGFRKQQLAASWEYLASHGNTTGASNLTILEHHLKRTQAEDEPSGQKPGDLSVCLGIGPGLAMESIVVRKC